MAVWPDGYHWYLLAEGVADGSDQVRRVEQHWDISHRACFEVAGAVEFANNRREHNYPDATLRKVVGFDRRAIVRRGYEHVARDQGIEHPFGTYGRPVCGPEKTRGQCLSQSRVGYGYTNVWAGHKGIVGSNRHYGARPNGTRSEGLLGRECRFRVKLITMLRNGGATGASREP